MQLDLNNLHFAERDDGATIQLLQDEISKKNKEMDVMKRKDFDTLRKQNESISHIQREFDDFADDANEQIQTLSAEVLRLKQLEAATDPGRKHCAEETAPHSEEVEDEDTASIFALHETHNAHDSANDISAAQSNSRSGNHGDVDNKIDNDDFKFKDVAAKETSAKYVRIMIHKFICVRGGWMYKYVNMYVIIYMMRVCFAE
jgi:hypothetical protein